MSDICSYDYNLNISLKASSEQHIEVVYVLQIVLLCVTIFRGTETLNLQLRATFFYVALKMPSFFSRINKNIYSRCEILQIKGDIND